MSPAAPSLDIMRRFKALGVPIVAYEDGVDSIPLGLRCLPLIAGARHVLDSATARFEVDLPGLVKEMLRTQARLQAEHERTRRLMNELGIVGQSEAMLSIFRTVLRISDLSDLPVLLTGDTGTGKELLARAIHRLDARRCRAPFVPVNCGAISSSLAESEMFGHRRGAFTGADRDREGLIRAANGGVLFLDEVSELGLNLQAKFLRVLQEYRVLGVGEDREVAVNFRVIAATNRDLGQMVRQGEFRADLYHRLNVVAIHLPPLSARSEDLKPLIEHFVSKYRCLTQYRVGSICSAFVEALAQVPLAGNVRQLENLVRQAMVNKRDDAPLDLSDLSPEIWRQLSTGPQPVAVGTVGAQRDDFAVASALIADSSVEVASAVEPAEWNLSRALRSCEMQLLQAAMRQTMGNQSKAGQILGITARSVYNKLRKHRLRP